MFQPLASYRVYNIEYAQLVCPWCFFEVSVDLLDKDGFGLLSEQSLVKICILGETGVARHTCILVTQSEVMLPIFDPVTPGALRASIDWRLASSSATQEDMMESGQYLQSPKERINVYRL